MIQAAADKAGASWTTPHTFRHTCASMLFERGANGVQVQRWLGHHSPAFTLARYVHLLSESLGNPLALTVELDKVGTRSPQKPAQDNAVIESADLAKVSEIAS